jgi:dTMP kinase
MTGRPPGRFIVIEGIDGSGTTLQTRALGEWLAARGHAVLETREPSTGAIGALARRRLAVDAAPDPATLALLFAADRLDHIAREVAPALAARQVVLSDRYLLSSFAYQALDCDEAWVRQINRQAPRPDLTLVLDVPADVAFARVQRRQADGAAVAERFDALDLQRRLAAAYRRLHDDPELGPMVVVPGDRPPGEVTAALAEALRAAGL